MNKLSVIPGQKAFKQCCGNCDAFILNPPAQQPASGPRNGACVANPPMLIQGMATVPGSQLSPAGPKAMPVWQGVWPPTQESRWCRAWQPEDDADDRDQQAS